MSIGALGEKSAYLAARVFRDAPITRLLELIRTASRHADRASRTASFGLIFPSSSSLLRTTYPPSTITESLVRAREA